MKRGIAILGSTGSIGTQALEVIIEHKDLFSVEVLTANNNCNLLIEQAKKHKPNTVVIVNQAKYNKVNSELSKLGINFNFPCGSKWGLRRIKFQSSSSVKLFSIVKFSSASPSKSRQIEAFQAKESHEYFPLS